VVAPLAPDGPVGWGGAGMVGAELLTGGALGWLARLPALALSMAGAVMSTTMGLSSVVQPDPALGGQSSAIARLMGLMAPLLVLSTGLYALPLQALAHSYQVVPPGALLPAGPLAEAVQQAASSALDLSLRLSAPFILAGLLLQMALGLLARLAPQLQVFTVAVPGQILGGLVLLGLLAAPLLTAWSEAMAAAWSVLPGL
jgi:flagellar biosynthetic protein FliR